MEEQLKDGPPIKTPDQQFPLDPLRRVFVPIEKKTANGTWVFRTSDKEMYVRLENGSIWRVEPRANGKAVRRLRRRLRAKGR